MQGVIHYIISRIIVISSTWRLRKVIETKDFIHINSNINFNFHWTQKTFSFFKGSVSFSISPIFQDCNALSRLYHTIYSETHDIINILKKCLNSKLTHFRQVLQFNSPWKHQKTKSCVAFRGSKIGALARNRLICWMYWRIQRKTSERHRLPLESIFNVLSLLM